MTGDRQWITRAVKELAADSTRSADTHLLRFPLPRDWGVDLYFKDESTHPTGSLKHRLAKSLFIYGLVGGRIHEGTTVVEASSGSTAVSEAYFARLLGLPFVAVMAASTSRRKVELIEGYGGTCVMVATAGEVYATAERIATEAGGYYLDQFANAAVATDWRGNNNIARSIFEQMEGERYLEPAWIVAGAGTGGTSATIARYARYAGTATRVAVGDPEGSAFESLWRTGRRDIVAAGSRIEGIGRPRVELSFLPHVIDLVKTIPDAASIAGMHVVTENLGRAPGPSTGTNLVLALELARGMVAAGERGSIVTLLCDGADRYSDTYYDAAWVARQGFNVEPHLSSLRQRLASRPLTRPPTAL
ncbi:PLP-dependent cysteine synthase family protein [Subtercola sp. PAMC28395]|uniref:PLP-dependent cysteine synthase family protein n=1 Tax=Subtercola sp. PAMC28395 TaxID=2846775 RepID=UPI001C0BF4B2|nr:PLP-dependent cysteine synthase family protein [Subtercola sp. PAMC28395]QWT22968.1 PLP-dependent cysteine synthase family protein [Subtercola sp. PAMC28395]